MNQELTPNLKGQPYNPNIGMSGTGTVIGANGISGVSGSSTLQDQLARTVSIHMSRDYDKKFIKMIGYKKRVIR